MHRRVEAVRALLEAEAAEHLGEQLLLRRDREVAVEERVVGRLARVRARSRSAPAAARRTRPRPRAVFIPGSYSSRNGVVRRVAGLHVLAPTGARASCTRRKAGRKTVEVVRLAGLEPGDVRLRGLACPSSGELGGDAAVLLPVAARDADQARVVGVVVELRPRAARARRAARRCRRDVALVRRARRASRRPQRGRERPSAASSSAGPSRGRRARARGRRPRRGAASAPRVRRPRPET